MIMPKQCKVFKIFKSTQISPPLYTIIHTLCTCISNKFCPLSKWIVSSKSTVGSSN